LPEVFKLKGKPWIKPDGSTTEKIIAQVKRFLVGRRVIL